ncbi:acyl-CoA carboxylase subunit epsilon [Streptomyces sp. NPDC088387]|uniref:acyl-CoA carboxylase subunit epsilon n=1 Tax=Streptomyces sp. NPDC088387 TaxID=3365859 RepID=UPI00382A8F85
MAVVGEYEGWGAGGPALRIERGQAGAVELAALTAVLYSVLAARATATATAAGTGTGTGGGGGLGEGAGEGPSWHRPVAVVAGGSYRSPHSWH